VQNINWKTVVGIIQREVPKLIDVQAEKERIKGLIHMACLRTATSEWLEWKEERLVIKNGIGKLPCNLIRLLKVLDHQGCNLHVNKEATAVIKPPFKEGTVFIHYYSMPMADVDGENLPRLIYEYANYYAWYCIHAILKEDWIMGKIPSDRFGWIEQRMDQEFDAAMANTNLYSITDLEEQLYMMQNGGFFNNNSL
jgi:hypothetical protein